MSEEKKDESVEKEIRFSMRPERQEGESFEEYKARRKMLKALDKMKKQGKVIWPSKVFGEWKKEFHGKEKEMVDEVTRLMNQKDDPTLEE
mgnify:CR=1 FL=1